MPNVLRYFTRNKTSKNNDLFADLTIPMCTPEKAHEIFTNRKQAYEKMVLAGQIENIEPPELWVKYDNGTEEPVAEKHHNTWLN